MGKRARKRRKEKLVVSLTTFPARILCAAVVVRAMLRQTVKADKVVLCLAEEQFPGRELPPEITSIKNRRFQIVWGEDLKPHKKYFYTMQMYPDAIVVTVDDDIYYPDTILEKLMESYRRFPNAVSCLRGHTIKLEKNGRFASYAEWHNFKKIIGDPSLLVLPTGVGGVLYPPHIFPQGLFDKEAIRKTSLMTDDLWLKWWQLVNKVPCVLAQEDFEMDYIQSSQEQALWKVNVDGNRNEECWKNILKFYSGYDHKDYLRIRADLKEEFSRRFIQPREQYIRKVRKGEPVRVKISVIMPVYNAEEYLHESIGSVLGQTLPEIELICVDDGSKDNSVKIIREFAKKDARVHLVLQKNSFAGCARNNGLRSAQGDYVYFMDADDWLDVTAFERLYGLVEHSREDMCVFFHYTYNEETGEIKNVPHYYAGVKKPHACSVTNFAKDSLYFIYNTVVPWNKIYRRAFLEEHGFQFSPLQCANDRSFYFDTVSKAKTVKIYNAFLLYYRIGNPKSISSLGRLKNFDPHFHSMEEILHRCADVPRKEYNMLIDVCMKDIWSYFHKASGILQVEIWRKIERFWASIQIPYSENKEANNYFFWYSAYQEIGHPVYPEERVIVSVTADRENISRVSECIVSLMMQSLHAEKTVLFLPTEQFPAGKEELPEQLLSLEGDAFEIRFCEDCGPVTNVVAAMREFPDAAIIAADGNMQYDFGMARRLYDSYRIDPKAVHAQQTDRLFVWDGRYRSLVRNRNAAGASYLNKPVADCGVLYPKGSIAVSEEDLNVRRALGREKDSLWLWCMAGKNGYRVRRACRLKEKRYAGGHTEPIAARFSEERDFSGLSSLAEKYPAWADSLSGEEDGQRSKFEFAGLLQEEILSLRKELGRKKESFENSVLSVIGARSETGKSRAQRQAEMNRWLRTAYGIEADFAAPVTYTDKLQWMKFYDSGRLKRIFTDKYAVRKRVAALIGEEHLIPLCGVYKKFDEIDFSALPASFTLKCSHGTGWEVRVADKEKMDIPSARAMFGEWMKSDFSRKAGMEMQYKGIKPRILAEKAVDSVGEWQVMCFGGRAELLLADRRENGEICRAVFGRDLEPLRFAFNNPPPLGAVPPPLGAVPPPAHAKELISLAEKCAAGFSFIRVDFCETEEGRVLFCGISFTPGMGIGIFVPKFYDYVYGAEIALPARAGGITERRKQK